MPFARAVDILLPRRPRPSDFVERHGGGVVAVACGVLAFVLLNLTIIALPKVEEKLQELRVRLEPAPQAAPEPEPPAAATQPVAMDELAATSVNPGETDEVRLDAREGVEETVLAMASTTTIEGWVPQTDADRERLASVVSRVRNLGDTVEFQETNAAAEVNRRMVESAGRKFLLNSDGGRAGIIRTIDVSSFPEDLVKRVLARYGISIEFRNVELDGETRSFLNSATTEAGTFTSVQREGYYEVFVMSAKALSMLSSMQLRALQDRGHDPMRTRVTKIVYGIVKDEEFGDYGLGVTEMEVEVIR